MNLRKLIPATLAFCIGLVSAEAPAHAAALNGNRVDVVLSGTVLETLAVVVALPTIAFGNVTPGTVNTAPLGQAVGIVTTWNLNVGRVVKMYAYFDTAAAAMTGTLTGDTIPVSAFTGSFNGGASASFSSSSPFTAAATSMTLFSNTITLANAVTLRTDSLALTMDLTNNNQLKTDIYAGTMHIQAQAV